jgi:hypothetical protein
VRFEPTISAGERPQTYALDRAATQTGRVYYQDYEIEGNDRSGTPMREKRNAREVFVGTAKGKKLFGRPRYR